MSLASSAPARGLLALAVASLAACGGRTVPGSGSGSEAAAAYPVLSRIPPGVPYAIVARQARDGVAALDALLDLAAMAELAASGADRAAAEARALLASIDLAAAGLDPDASAAVFGQGGWATALVRVADPAALAGFLDDRGARPSPAGREVSTFSIGSIEVAAAVVDGWWAVHAVDPRRPADLAWLDQLAAAPDGASLAGEAIAAEATRRGAEGLARARGSDVDAPPTLIGLVRTRELGRELAATGEVPDGVAACAERMAAAAPRLLLAAGVSPAGIDLWSSVDLSRGAARAVREKLSPPPPPGYAEYRAGAAIAVDWAVDPDLFERARAAARCPGLDRPLIDPVQAMTGFAGPIAWHLAATALDPDDMSGEAAVHLVLVDPGLIQSQLESIPARSLFERNRRVAGVPIKVLSVPGLPSVAYRLERDRFTAALGDGVMEVLLGPGVEAFPADELGRFELRPLRLPNLRDLLATAFDLLGGRSAARAGAALAGRLAGYEQVSVRAHLDGDSVALFARLRRAAEGRAAPVGPLRSGRRALW